MTKHILVVGDDAMLLAQISCLLSDAGYKVSTQTHATYDPAHARNVQAILIVVDRTPDDDTIWNTVQRMRLDRILMHLPLIICTDLAPNARETRFYRERRIMFVQKPFEDGSLLAAVNLTLQDNQVALVAPTQLNGWH
jgi:DNA-binding response OmpR family regulator